MRGGEHASSPLVAPAFKIGLEYNSREIDMVSILYKPLYGGPDIPMPQQLADHPDITIFLERVIGKAETERKGADSAPIRFQLSEPAATRSPSVRWSGG